MFAQTPAPPYYAVIFSSRRTGGDHVLIPVSRMLG